jgi:hypothetical protein
MNLKMTSVYSAVLIIILSSGCRSGTQSESLDDRAMNALGSSQNIMESDFGTTFWADQVKRNTPLWHRAIAWCDSPEHKALQNCEQLQQFASLSGPTNPFMPPNASGPPVTLGLTPPKKH